MATSAPPARPRCPGEDVCPWCSRDLETPPSTWALLQPVALARPYQWELLAGFLLTLLGTAATLVPPYLTMPLMDKVLIPYQNGVPIDYDRVKMYLAGLLGAALVAWSLGWARTYLLARVSERIGADLRTTTYEHLLKLSLEYFGGKRTGDLMARIGSESDRICVFLSLHLLDFADRRADDRHDGHHPDLDQSVAGAGDAGAAAVHRLDDPPRARPTASRLREDRPRLVRDHQRAGRYDSRHPRGQGLRPGKARGRPLPRGQQAQPGRQRSRQCRCGRCSRPR